MQNRTKGLARALLAPLALGAATACVTTEEIYARNNCYEMTSAEIEIDCENSSWSVSGFCVRVLHPACAEISYASIRIGADSNENGKLDPGEEQTTISLPGPSDTVCSGHLSGNVSQAGVPMIVEVKVYVEGEDGPIYSDTDSIG